MTDSRQERRRAILAKPTEKPKIECKTWLDLNDNHDKAVIAKAAIALANSDGGTIVFGVSEDNSAGRRLTCEPRPPGLSRYTGDAIGSAINKYADPDIDFNLEFENHPETGEEYAFVEIPGGMQQPVFAKKSFEGVINRLTCYVRKPGPKSEEPRTAQEWRDLLNRCARANRDSLLDGIRTINNGRPVDSSPSQSNEQQLREFMVASKARWQERLHEVEEDDVARLRRGYWAFAFSIVGESTWASLNDLRRALDETRPTGLRRRLFADVTGQVVLRTRRNGRLKPGRAIPGKVATAAHIVAPFGALLWVGNSIIWKGSSRTANIIALNPVPNSILIFPFNCTR